MVTTAITAKATAAAILMPTADVCRDACLSLLLALQLLGRLESTRRAREI